MTAGAIMGLFIYTPMRSNCYGSEIILQYEQSS